MTPVPRPPAREEEKAVKIKPLRLFVNNLPCLPPTLVWHLFSKFSRHSDSAPIGSPASYNRQRPPSSCGHATPNMGRLPALFVGIVTVGLEGERSSPSIFCVTHFHYFGTHASSCGLEAD